jgi:hypothetical protein
LSTKRKKGSLQEVAVDEDPYDFGKPEVPVSPSKKSRTTNAFGGKVRGIGVHALSSKSSKSFKSKSKSSKTPRSEGLIANTTFRPGHHGDGIKTSRGGGGRHGGAAVGNSNFGGNASSGFASKKKSSSAHRNRNLISASQAGNQTDQSDVDDMFD